MIITVVNILAVNCPAVQWQCSDDNNSCEYTLCSSLHYDGSVVLTELHGASKHL